MTQERLNEILKEEIEKANVLTLNLVSINPQVEIRNFRKFFGMFSRYRGTSIHSNNDYIGKVCISKFFLSAPEDEIRAVIMHEICHGIIGSKGHDIAWQVAVNEVMKKYGDTYENAEYHLSRFLDKNRGDFMHSEIICKKEKFKYAIACKKCGYTIKRKRMCDCIKHPENYFHPTCNTEFIRTNIA